MRPVIVIRLRKGGGYEAELTTDSDRKMSGEGPKNPAYVTEEVLRFGDSPKVEVALDRISRVPDQKAAVECILARLAAHLTKESLIDAVAQMGGQPATRPPAQPASRRTPNRRHAPAVLTRAAG